MEQFVKLNKMGNSNDVSKLRTPFNKIEITLQDSRSLDTETSSYGSLLIPVQASTRVGQKKRTRN